MEETGRHRNGFGFALICKFRPWPAFLLDYKRSTQSLHLCRVLPPVVITEFLSMQNYAKLCRYNQIRSLRAKVCFDPRLAFKWYQSSLPKSKWYLFSDIFFIFFFSILEAHRVLEWTFRHWSWIAWCQTRWTSTKGSHQPLLYCGLHFRLVILFLIFLSILMMFF